MLEAPYFQELMSVILSEGQECECPHKDTCGNLDSAWCRHLVAEGDRVRIVDYRDLSLAQCVYRDRPGCCWVLAAVERLASEYLDQLHVKGPPVPSNLIAAFDDSREIEVRLVPLRSLHGAVWLLENDWVVQLNATDSPQIQRETLFHEAFHITCRTANPAFRRADMGYMPFRDVLADHFATCLLMPKKWIKEHASAMTNARKIAETFDVSVPAMKHRLKQLDISHGRRPRVPGVLPLS
jgi:hypothetical protein